MPAFDGKVKTSTRVRLDRDSFSPNMGALVGSAFQEDALIHGSRNEVVASDITLMFQATVTRTVMSNVTDSIMGSLTETVMGSTTQTHVGSVTKTLLSTFSFTVIGSELDTIVGPHVRTNVGPVTWLNPTASMVNSGDWMETKIGRMQNYAIRNTNIAVDISTRVENCQIALHSTGIVQFTTPMKITQLLVKLIDLYTGVTAAELAASDAKLRAFDSMLNAMHTELGPRTMMPPESLPGVE
jgi:hypothetical protein